MPLTAGWIKDQLADKKLPPVGLSGVDTGLRWSAFRKDGKEQHPDQVKSVVNSADYEKMEVELGRTFLVRKSMSPAERASYVALLREYSDYSPGVRTTCGGYLRSWDNIISTSWTDPPRFGKDNTG